MKLKNKKIILGVCGGIAAYKSCYLVRELIKAGADVKVVMTPSACEFVTPLTFSTLSQNEVVVDIFPKDKKGNLKLSTWHIELGLWADLMVIAPATVNTIAKLNYGIADNALTTLAMALRCPLLVAPAADMDMYEDESNKKNIFELKSKGVFFVEPDSGELASGLIGIGRLAEINIILKTIENLLTNSYKDYNKKKILITAGPTYEPIDSVRFIGNYSSGKMGFYLALASYYRGADVTVISGPTNLEYPKEINLIKVKTADEMFAAVKSNFKKSNIFISAAAVADFKPKNPVNYKLKKDKNGLKLELVHTPDILFNVSKIKTKNQKLIGFALETDNELANAFNKMKKKNLDMIVLNNPKIKGSGFNTDTNQISIIFRDGSIISEKLMHKFDVANVILNHLRRLFR